MQAHGAIGGDVAHAAEVADFVIGNGTPGNPKGVGVNYAAIPPTRQFVQINFEREIQIMRINRAGGNAAGKVVHDFTSIDRREINAVIVQLITPATPIAGCRVTLPIRFQPE